MTELCLRCGVQPVADEGPPRFPFCETCWPVISARNNYFVDECGNFTGFMTPEEEAEHWRQAGEAALAQFEQEEAGNHGRPLSPEEAPGRADGPDNPCR